MNSKRSGGLPRIYKAIALAAIIGIAVTGCENTIRPPDSFQSSSFDDFSNITDSSDFMSSSDFVDSSSFSSSGAMSSSSVSSSPSSVSPPDESSSSSTSEVTSSGSTPESSSSSASSSKSSSSASSSKALSSSSVSSSKSSSSSSSSAPVVIPDFEVPTSPGTAVLTANNIVLDYSNAMNGYVSVKYTGSAKRVKFRYVSADKVYTFDVATNGAVQYFPLSCGSGSYTFYVFEIIEGSSSYSTALQQTVSIKITNDTKPYTYSNSYVEYSKSSNCVKKAAELCAGKTSTLDKISAIFLYITDNITYDYALAKTVQPGYIPNPDKTLRIKTGICFDYASLMAAMLRSQGIPTRLVIGYAKTDIYHAWNEIYTEETGWITTELLLSKRGYNIVDATFYANNTNKKKIADYIMDSTNYAAVYYY